MSTRRRSEQDEALILPANLRTWPRCEVILMSPHRSLLLSYQKSNPNIAPTYLLSGPLKSTSKLETTAIDLSRAGSPNLNGTQSLAHLATQGVRIVDMDEMSDADRNSEDGDADELDEMGMKNDDGRPGNDEGHADGLAGVVRFKVEREDEILEPEEVPKWGVVLVQADHLEREFRRGSDAHGLGGLTSLQSRKSSSRPKPSTSTFTPCHPHLSR